MINRSIKLLILGAVLFAVSACAHNSTSNQACELDHQVEGKTHDCIEENPAVYRVWDSGIAR